MSAKRYHFCQRCQQMISPSINDDMLRAYDQVANYNKYVSTYLSRLVLSRRCPKCAAPWKAKLLYVGEGRMLHRSQRASRVLRELQRPDRIGWTNRWASYKRLQQAKCRARNPI